MSAKFKAFSFPVIKSYSVVPVFRSSVIPRFPVSLVWVRTGKIWFAEQTVLLCHGNYAAGHKSKQLSSSEACQYCQVWLM